MSFKENLEKLREAGGTLSILYVEDESEIRETTAVLLGLIFNDVDTAADGAEAIQKYRTKHYDLIISDLLMPVMSGYEMIRAIRQSTPSQNIVVTTACEEDLYGTDLETMGITHVIAKPMSAEQIVDTLYDVLVSHTR